MNHFTCYLFVLICIFAVRSNAVSLRSAVGYVPAQTRYPWYHDDDSFLCVSLQQENGYFGNIRASLSMKLTSYFSSKITILAQWNAANILPVSPDLSTSHSFVYAISNCLKIIHQEHLRASSLLVVKFRIEKNRLLNGLFKFESEGIQLRFYIQGQTDPVKFLILPASNKPFEISAPYPFPVLKSWADLNKERLDVVVAYYNGDLNWMYSLPPDSNVIVYYKEGKEPSVLPYLKHESIQLINEGCEVHTFLTHITRNYHNLAENTFFAPASPDAYWYKRKAFCYILDTLHSVSNTAVLCSHFHGNRPGLIPNRRAVGFTKAETRPFDSWFSKYVNDKAAGPQSEYSCYAGMMVVPRALILSRPLDYYIRLKNLLEEKINPEEAGFCERSWAAIFNSE